MKQTRSGIQWWLRSRLATLAVVLLLSACGGLPVLTTPDKADEQMAVERCRRPFLDKPYRMVHAMETRVGGDPQGNLMGITLFDPRTRDVHSALLTLEGFVLFEAGWEKDLVKILRAVPPFDQPRLAENTLKDIRFIFLAPEGALRQCGTREEDGATVCRYDGELGGTVDVAVHKDDSWEVTAYSANNKPLRQVTAKTVRNGVPEWIELTGYAVVNYSLNLTLISAEPIAGIDVLKSDK